MRCLKIFLFLLCGVFMLSCTEKGSVLHDTKGNEIQLSALKGKWIIVNYWADWCESCVQEIPELNRFYQNNQDKNILIYGVNYDRLPKADLEKATKKVHIVFPVLLDDLTQIWPLQGIDVLPVTFIINPKGQVVKRIYGGNTEKSLSTTLQALQKNLIPS